MSSGLEAGGVHLRPPRGGGVDPSTGNRSTISDTMPKPDEIARSALQALDGRRQIAPFAGLAVEAAYRAAAVVRDA